MIDRKFIGTVFEARAIDVEKGAIRFFAQAIGESSPIYRDEEAARAAGHPAIPAPPTFIFCLNHMAPGKGPGLLELLGIDIGRILHGEQHFEYQRPIHAGDRLTFTARITDIYDKKNGALEFIAMETSAVNQRGEPVCMLRATTVVRN